MPRFSLKMLLIAIALLALFLGWLRLDRVRVSDPSQLHPAEEFWFIEFQPLLYPGKITIRRAVEFDGVHWSCSLGRLDANPQRP